MKKIPASIIGASMAIWSISAARAVDFSSVDLKPLFHIHMTKKFKTQPEFPPQKEIFDDEDLFVTQGGATTLLIFLRSEDTEFGTEMIRVVSPQQPLASFIRVLAMARIGVRTSCELDTEGATTGHYDISWYGKHGRSNSFTVVLAAAGTSAFPPCPPEAQGIIMAVTEYESSVLGAPGAEVFQSH